jgi:phosphate transport system permease protein
MIAPTRTPAFEARLKQRYASERRFKAAGIAAVGFSVLVLVFLLGTMLMNGIGGFQRTVFDVPVSFDGMALSVQEDVNEGTAVRALQSQGLPEIVAYAAEQALGAEAAAQVNAEAWRDVAEDLVADPSLARTGGHRLRREADQWRGRAGRKHHPKGQGGNRRRFVLRL